MANRIGICSDHGGTDLKVKVMHFLKTTGYEVIDFGVAVGVSGSVDYPDFAALLARDVSEGKISHGIAICGTGIGMSIACNKFKDVRATLVSCEFTARMSRMHNDSNVLCMGARTSNHDRALDFTKIWLETSFEGGRHQQRIEKLSKLER
jgi:ribose 5-phosphate isomerase B